RPCRAHIQKSSPSFTKEGLLLLCSIYSLLVAFDGRSRVHENGFADLQALLNALADHMVQYVLSNR
ncbi:hypothetical protein ACIFQM_24505, partial [Paenibacillus sp. NRS-1782]|uniref:hypothetical protein n=1 Tax=unclassified Paenibacillus TaxID=185978 RepID=UPI003D285FBA